MKFLSFVIISLFLSFASAKAAPTPKVSNQHVLEKVRKLVSLSNEATIISKCINTGENEYSLSIVVANSGQAIGSISVPNVTNCLATQYYLPKKINKPTRISVSYYYNKEWLRDHWLLFPKSKPVLQGKGK